MNCLDPRRASVSLALVLLVSSIGAAQCPMPDNLVGPPGSCCLTTQPTLPSFPGIADNALGICWRNCAVDATVGCSADFTPPVPASTASIPPICTVYTTKLTLSDAAGSVKWKGRLRMWYSRTWMIIGPNGADWQVWRLLLNGDMKPTAAAGGPPCPVPPCASSFGNRVRYTGYIDYAQDCSTGAWEFSWMLNHDCDLLEHRPGFPRGGSFHNGRSYSFVGPAAGFTPSIATAVESGTAGPQAVRVMDLPVPGAVAQCYFEEPLTSASITPTASFCACGPGPAQYEYSNLTVTGTCGSSVLSTLQWPQGFVSKSLGSWTDPTIYPGVMDVRWNMSGVRYDDCFGIAKGEVFYGATTRGGFVAFPFGGGAVLPPTFVDQGNSLRPAGGVTTMNVPYISNHIITLNLP